LSEPSGSSEIVYALACAGDINKGGLCFAARSSALYLSEDGGESWRIAYSKLEDGSELATTAVALSPTFDRDQSLFAGVTGIVMRSSDAGDSWYYSRLGSPPPIITALAVSPDFTRDGTALAGTMEDGLFRSEDRGNSWMACNFGLTDLSILSMAISPDFQIDGRVYMGTENGVFYSTNGGRAWKESGFPVEKAPVLCLALSPEFSKDGRLWAGTESHGLFTSVDRGKTWQRLAEGTLEGSVNAVVVSSLYPKQADIMAMTSDTLLLSQDGGNHWREWQDGFKVEDGLICMAAPQNWTAGMPVLVGTASGEVLKV
jgi:photosystem II stability/assembly factor-like uncharacterized protein